MRDSARGDRSIFAQLTVQAHASAPTAMHRHPPLRPPPYSLERATLEREIEVDTFRASGPGGQHVNRTESAVRLTHAPSGVVVVAADTRSQIRNREIALERLVERLARLNRRPKPRKPTGVSRAVKARRLAAKRRHGEVKRMRTRRPGPED